MPTRIIPKRGRATASSRPAIVGLAAMLIVGIAPEAAYGLSNPAHAQSPVPTPDPVLAAASAPVFVPKPGIRYYVIANFNKQPLGHIRPSRFSRSLGKVPNYPPIYDDMRITKASPSRGNVLRVTLDAHTINSKPAGNNGIVLPVRVPSRNRMCITYDIKFDKRFEWSLGGKLPGLGGVAPGVPPSEPAGGGQTDRGWSGRLMWLGPGAYSWAGPTNEAVSYMYHPGQQSYYGDNVRWNKAFKADKWHTVKQCYVMNTVGKRDGVLRAWIDGAKVVDRRDYVYRTRSDVQINYLMWSVFRGGNTMDWASDRPGYVWFDKVLITDR